MVKKKLEGVTRLILQPNIAAHHIREWFIENGWELIHEKNRKRRWENLRNFSRGSEEMLQRLTLKINKLNCLWDHF